MLQRSDGRVALNAVMAQSAATAEAVMGVNMQPHGIRRVAWFPTLRTKLQCASLLYRDAFGRCIQVSLGNIQSVGESPTSLCFEHRGVAAFNLADALGMDTGLFGHGLLTHAEG